MVSLQVMIHKEFIGGNKNLINKKAMTWSPSDFICSILEASIFSWPALGMRLSDPIETETVLNDLESSL